MRSIVAGLFGLVFLLTGAGSSPQGEEAGSRLVFPDLNQTQGVNVGYAVLNPLSDPSQVTFSAYDADGDLIEGPGVTNPAVRELEGQSQLALFASDIFGFALEDEVLGWMEVTADSEELKGFFITLEDGLERVDGADASTVFSDTFTLMFPPDADPVEGVLHLVNPQDTAAQTTVQLLSSGGALLDEAERVIPAHGKLQSSPADLVPEILNQQEVYLRVESSQEIAAYQTFRVGESIAGLNGLISTPVQTLYSPQLGTGPNLKSLLQLVNNDSQSRTFTLTARDEAGQLLAEAAGPSLQGVPANPRQVVVESGALLVADLAEFFGIPEDELRSGWIEVTHQTPDQPVPFVASILFGDNQGSVFNASLPLQAEGKLINLYSHLAEGQFGPIRWFTGIALLNTTDKDANVSITVRDTAGAVTAAGGLQLLAGQRISKTLPEILPGFGPQAGGSVSVVSDVELFSFSLFGLTDLSVLAAIPTQPFESIVQIDGNEPVGGVIEESVIRIPEGTELNPVGPLELIADQSILVEGDIVSQFPVALRSPNGTVVVGGSIDTSAGNGAEPANLASRMPQGDVDNPSPNIEIEAELIVLEGGFVPEFPETPEDINIAPTLQTGQSSQAGGGGGRIGLHSHTIVLIGNLVYCKTGDGTKGQGATAMGQKKDSGAGGNIEVATEFVLKGNPEEEAYLTLVTGKGGENQATFPANMTVLTAWGANGGNGGNIELQIVHSTVENFFLSAGRGGVGQPTRARGFPAGQSVESHAGGGGDGGWIDFTSDLQPSTLAPDRDVKVTAFVTNGAKGGNATGIPADGRSGDSPTGGGGGVVSGGFGGLDGFAAPIAGTVFSAIFVKERFGVDPPQGGDAIVRNGNGGNSTSPIADGAPGGDIVATPGGARSIRALSGVARINDAANGGDGFNGCVRNPRVSGTKGGDGGLVRVVLGRHSIHDSGNGGMGGDGWTGVGQGGEPKDPEFQLSIPIMSPDYSFNPGLPGTACPPNPALPGNSPVRSRTHQGTVERGNNEIDLPMQPGNELTVTGTMDQFSLSLELIDFDTGHHEAFPVFAVEPEAPPFDAFGMVSVRPGNYEIRVLAFADGINFSQAVGQADLRDGNAEVEVELVDLSPPERFPVEGTLTNPTPLFVSFIQFLDEPARTFLGVPLNFPTDPASVSARSRRRLSGSSGTYSTQLPDGEYEIRIRGSRSDPQSATTFSFGPLVVSGGGTTRDVVLPSLFSVSGSVTAQDFRSVSLLSGPVNATSNEADFQVLVPEGSYLLELRRRILVDGSVTGDLFFEAGSILVEGDLDLGQVTFPDTVDFFSTTLTVLDQTAEGIPNATVSFESTLLEDDPRMRFLGVRRTDENGVIEIDMPAGNYVFQVDLP